MAPATSQSTFSFVQQVFWWALSGSSSFLASSPSSEYQGFLCTQLAQRDRFGYHLSSFGRPLLAPSHGGPGGLTNEAIQVCRMVRLYFIVLIRCRITHMKGITIIQAREKMPWNNDGARHAQVEFHWPVPRVIPAAINAPTLDKIRCSYRGPDSIR